MCKKYVAIQNNSDWMETPLDMFCRDSKGRLDLSEEWPGIIITGNRDYWGYTTDEYEHIKRYIDELVYDWENGCYEARAGRNIAEHLNNNAFRRADGKRWNTQQLHKWAVLLNDILNNKYYSDDDEVFIQALSLIYNTPYAVTEIRGNSQGEWQNVYYPKDKYTKTAMEILESEYFGLGVEFWISENPVELPDNMDCEEIEFDKIIENNEGCYMYVHDTYRPEDEIIGTISSALSANDVVIFTIDSYAPAHYSIA